MTSSRRFQHGWPGGSQRWHAAAQNLIHLDSDSPDDEDEDEYDDHYRQVLF